MAQVPGGREDRLSVAPGGAAVPGTLVEDAVIQLTVAGARVRQVERAAVGGELVQGIEP